jgi:hypothetical protein
VNHDTPIAIGEIILWESGEMDVEAIRIEDGKQLFLHHYELVGEPDFDEILKTYLNVLIEGS